MGAPTTLMASKKTTLLRRRTSARRLTVDPTRLALAAMERIKTVLERKGHLDRFGPPASLRDLVARSELLGCPLPPSYSAAMRVAGTIGGREVLLTAPEMVRTRDDVLTRGRVKEAERWLPFARFGDQEYACFDRMARPEAGELPVFEWSEGSVRPRARHFAEWIDLVADQREEEVELAARMPSALRTLLDALGFGFEDPIVGRLETGDTEAIEELLGPERTRDVRGTVDRLFDSSGKASITLNVDEFSMAVALRTGIFVFEAEEVFRWLRTFRDENFFADSTREPSHPDRVRDLRRALREPPLILRGVLEMAPLAARKHAFWAAGGRSIDDFYLLGRTSSTMGLSASLILHVVGGEVKGAHSLDEPLTNLYVAPDGVVWGLSHAGTAVRFRGDSARAFPLSRKTRGRTAWHGIGGGAQRVFVWGAGALLEFKEERFVQFEPDARLEEHESVVSLHAGKRDITMLVCGEHLGAVAQFDGKKWQSIGEDQVIDGAPVDMDVWRGSIIVLGRGGEVWRLEGGSRPKTVTWDRRLPAFVADGGAPRVLYRIRGFDGGALLASDGGVISVGAGDPIFHKAQGTLDPVRLARVGTEQDDKPGIVAMVGAHAWIWRKDGFFVIDLRAW
jgi:SMI1 / KNR4 family (SUKH-1)